MEEDNRWILSAVLVVLWQKQPERLLLIFKQKVAPNEASACRKGAGGTCDLRAFAAQVSPEACEDDNRQQRRRERRAAM
jgi:hypothetical protein